MDSVLGELQKHQILDKVSLIQTNTLLCEKRQHTEPKTQLHETIHVSCQKNVSQQTLFDLKKTFKKLKTEVDIKYSIGVGQKIKEYKNLHKVFSQQETTLFHVKGQVLLIDIWSTRCGPCQQSMEHNKKMLENNEQRWKNKIRIVAVSVDKQKQMIKQRVQSRGWSKMQHLTLLQWNDEHPLIKDFQIEGIPFVILVNKEGKIDFTGNPTEIDLEERINQLLQESKQQQVKDKKPQMTENLSQSLISQIQKSKIIGKILTEQSLNQMSKKFPLFFISAQQNLHVQNGVIVKNLTKIKISTDQNTPQLIDDIKNILQKIDSKSYRIENKPIPTEKIPQIQNYSCAQCKVKLSYPLYWCKWDSNENKFRCRKCVQKKPNDQNQHYSYKNNSVLITGPWNRVYSSHLGKNLQPHDLQSQQNRNIFGCNSCGKCPQKVGQPRYVCTVCNFDPNGDNQFCDLCQDCVNSLIQGDTKIINELKSDGHDPNHPLLRILYRVNDYLDF